MNAIDPLQQPPQMVLIQADDQKARGFPISPLQNGRALEQRLCGVGNILTGHELQRSAIQRLLEHPPIRGQIHLDQAALCRIAARSRQVTQVKTGIVPQPLRGAEQAAVNLGPLSFFA